MLRSEAQPTTKNDVLKFTRLSWPALLLAAFALPAFAQQPTAAERALMLKATMAASEAVLRQYQWVETTVVSLKGEEKSRKQAQCYYGVQKIELNKSPAPKQKRGLRWQIAAKKTEELTDYMKNAIALVKSYEPPSPASAHLNP